VLPRGFFGSCGDFLYLHAESENRFTR